jgi:hypothetical protein
MFLQVGGGSGFSGLHGQPDVSGGGVVVAAGGGGAAGLVAAGGGVVVFFGGCCVAGAELSGLGGSLVGEVELCEGELEVEFGVDLIQVEAGVRVGGASSDTPWIAIPTSTPSNADPSTAEPPAAHSARTESSLMLAVGSQAITPLADYRLVRSQENARLDALSAP